ncbi:Ca-activated chloride channel family protein [Maritalea mobilis]|uniref:Ca-activated chloride channel family protein n=1 Tax=Maritalea mobilis TaxID=483324 RepID=A0A4R6VGD6_9HYPH|nr:VWA domain-containing protein [Maritalea mobilis]TDQ60407.1 Ca-activated chloride channel family protein [Maritalea mobilis]
MKKLAMITIASLAMGATAVSAQEAGRTIIVMDGSGSMWGQIEGVPKLQIAREAVANLLPQLDADQALGLVAYGHRRRGDCSDIEVLVQPALGQSEAITDAVNKMRFQGKTPLSAAVRQAAEALRFTEEPATVVLVTDGLETCAADPCALGIELEEAGIDFTAHVIGFGLSQAEGAQVACLAQNTGGQYVSAKDADGLTAALNQTVAQTAEVKSTELAEPEPIDLPTAKLMVDKQSTPITTAIEVSWDGPNAEDDFIDIVSAKTPEQAGLDFIYTANGNPQLFKMPATPGDYILRYRWTGRTGWDTIATLPITVTEAEFVLDAPQSAEQGEMVEVTWKGPNNADDYIDTIERGASRTDGEVTYAWARDGNPAQLQMPITPGEYDLRYVVQGEQDRSVGLVVPLTVLPTTANLVAPAQVKPGAEFEVQFNAPNTSGDWVDIVTPGYEEFSGEITYFYTEHAQNGVGRLTAPAEEGTFELRYVLEGRDGRIVLVRKPLIVTAGAEDTIISE